MVCGVPVLACDNGGPTESVVDPDFDSSSQSDEMEERTGWLRKPDPEVWATALREVIALSPTQRRELGERAARRAKEKFGMEAMAANLEISLKEAVAMGPTPFGFWPALLVLGLLGILLAAIASVVLMT